MRPITSGCCHLGETYGYSVLEAQGAGCPLLTTGLRAHHDPVTHATRLREIYDEALG